MSRYIYLGEIGNKNYKYGFVSDIKDIPNNIKIHLFVLFSNNKNIENELFDLFVNKYIYENNVFTGNLLDMITDINEKNKFIINIDEKINNMEHEHYGGTKNLFKLCYNDEINNYYIHSLYGNQIINNQEFISILNCNDIYDSNDNNLKLLFDNKKIYIKKDLNIKINTTKYNNKIFQLFSDIVFYNEYIQICDNKNNKDWNEFEIKKCKTENEKLIEIIKINDEYYELEYLKNNIPYIIIYNEETKEYYYLNDKYGLIGDDFECHHLYHLKNFNKKINLYSYSYNQVPWISEINFRDYIYKLTQFIQNIGLTKNIDNKNIVFLK